MGEHTHTEQVLVRAPAERVWEVLVDVERWPAWTASVRRVARLDDGPLAVGARVRIEQPRLPTTVWTVDRLEPGRSFSWTSHRPGVRTDADHRVDDAPDGCLVTLALRQSGPLAGLSHRLFAGLVRRYVRLEAEGLKREAEQGV